MSKRLSTISNVTNIWLSTSVDSRVNYPTSSIRECLFAITNVTNEWLFASVNPDMFFQTLAFAEAFTTIVTEANKWFLICVNSFVHSETLRLGKLSWTLITNKGLFTCMDSHVYFEISRISERLLTVFELAFCERSFDVDFS